MLRKLAGTMPGMSQPTPHLRDPRKYPEREIALPLTQTSDPTPPPGCDVCRALARQRARARELGDFSGVADCNVEMRRHPHTTRRGKR